MIVRMHTTRRVFARGLLAAGLAAAVTPRRLFAAVPADFDETFAVFLSDVHVNGLDKDAGNGKPFKTSMRHWLKANVANWREPKTVPWLTLPSNGCWGDIGYVTMRVAAGKWHGRKVAQAKFVQKDFFLGNPVAPEKRNPVWDARLEDVKGAKCTFVI